MYYYYLSCIPSLNAVDRGEDGINSVLIFQLIAEFLQSVNYFTFHAL